MRRQEKQYPVLIINCGSSSLKYEVFEMPSRQSVGKGIIERIGDNESTLEQESICGIIKQSKPIPDYAAAIAAMIKAMLNTKNGFLETIEEITCVGHRVVHGGEHYTASVIIDKTIIKAIENNIPLAPLHNPSNLVGIHACMKCLPECIHVAVFDTAFHQTMPPAAYLYGIPRKYYEKYRIRRYGFHGTSHRYVVTEALHYIKRSHENSNAISCHLGNGASITAIRNGRSIDTSMGFTPLEGLMMGTRSGDIDPSVLIFLLEQGMSVDELRDMLNRQSGLLGLSGISNDLRDIEEMAERGDRNAIETLETYAHRARRYIGAYAANLVKLDVLIFTGGIGQHGFRMRERICNHLESIGIFMDYRRNLENGANLGIISHEYSPVTIMVVPTNEELQIAIDAFQLYQSSHS